ncbi:MAG: FtsX-like permease family protein, partial [Flavobacteriales bacterium]|nr:FtsX-like permease family protein [Flavobacteriales bacterium]
NYGSITAMDSMMIRGEFKLQEAFGPVAIAGLGVYSELGAGFRPGEYDVITINAPIRGKKLRKSRENAFNSMPINLGGIYSINAELDVKYIFAPIDFCRELFGFEDEISSIEIKAIEGTDLNLLKANINQILPDGLVATTQFEKNALVFQTTESEKWAVSLILLFILVIAAFNIIASLTMLIIEKKKDIFILSSFGASPLTINRIFTLEGVLIYFIGAVLGLILGVGLCLLQQHYGLVRLEGSMVEHYPVEVRWGDLVGIIASVMLVGVLFSVLLVKYLVKRFALHEA